MGYPYDLGYLHLDLNKGQTGSPHCRAGAFAEDRSLVDIDDVGWGYELYG